MKAIETFNNTNSELKRTIKEYTESYVVSSNGKITAENISTIS